MSRKRTVGQFNLFEFSPVVGDEIPVPVRATLAFVRGSFMGGTSEEQNSVYLRWLNKTARVTPVADRTRDLTTQSSGMLEWSRKGNAFGKHIVWGGEQLGPDALLLEVYEVIGTNGLPLTDSSGDVPVNRKVVRTHDKNQTGLGACVIPAATNPWYRHAKYAISEIVNGPDTTTNLGITNIGTFQDPNQPWVDGPVTPAGQYELRVCINNRDEGLGPSGFPQGTIRHPPPDMDASHTGQPSGWACQVKTNPAYDGVDPHQTQYLLDMFSYDLAAGAPGTTLDPATTASKWTAITSPPSSVVKQDYSQSALVFGSRGCGYFDVTAEDVWLIRAVSAGTSKFRYIYTCTLVAKLKDSSTVTKSGKVFQRDYVDWVGNGLRVLQTGVIVHDDTPNGLLSLVRVDEGAFPTNGSVEHGGKLDLSSPPASESMRGLATASRFGTGVWTDEDGVRDKSAGTPRDIAKNRWSIDRWGTARPGGDFWIPLLKLNHLNTYIERRVARKALSVVVPTYPAMSGNVVLVEAGGRVWVFGLAGFAD